MENKKNTNNGILSKINEMKEKAVMPKRIPIISTKPLVGALALEYKGYREDEGNEEAHLRLKDESADKEIPEFMTLCFLYGMFLEKYKRYETDLEMIRAVNADPEPFLHEPITIYLSDYIRAIGMKPNINKANKDKIAEKIKGYSEFVGRIRTKKKKYADGKLLPPEYKEYELIEPGSFKYENPKGSGGILKFASPYMTAIVWKVMEACVKHKYGRPKLDEFGKPSLRLGYSRRLSPTVLKGPCKKKGGRKRYPGHSAEIVAVVTTLIDRAGRFRPSISYEQIIERCGCLRHSLYRKPNASSANEMLEAVFSEAWRTLRYETDIGDIYKEFKFPELTPTIDTLKDVVEFPHSAKKNSRKKTEKERKPEKKEGVKEKKAGVRVK